VAARLRKRIDGSLERIAFFVVPSAMAFVALGDVVAGAVFQHGHFTAADTRFSWYLLAGSAVGLLATTSGRLYSTSFYALKDTRTPLRAAVVRVFATAVMAYVSAVKLPAWLGVPRELGGVGIIATTGLAAWIEYQVLKRRLTQRIGATGMDARKLLAFWSAAALAAACALGTKAAMVGWFGAEPGLAHVWGGDVSPFPHVKPLLVAPLILGVYGGLYLALTAAAGVSPLLERLKARFLRK
jgi:putative peptidoglycan lipid II flippase